MKLKIVYTSICLATCKDEGLPPWYLGLAYRDLSLRTYTYYIIPLNFIIRWAKYIGYWIGKTMNLKEYQFIYWGHWTGLSIGTYKKYRGLSMIYKWSFRFLFWEIRKHINEFDRKKIFDEEVKRFRVGK